LVNSAIPAVFRAAFAVAAIARDYVSVVAAFARIKSVVTAALDTANPITTVSRRGVTIITGLKSGAQDAVAAKRQGAAVKAGVGVHTVSVITGLKSSLALLSIKAPDAVATNRETTAVGTAVSLAVVAIITRFPVIDSLVATNFLSATQVAAVAQHLIAIIAVLAVIKTSVTAALIAAQGVATISIFDVAIVTGFIPGTPHAITAGGQGAGVTAGIGVHAVAIVAGFEALFAWVKAETLNSITAGGELATVGAGIAVNLVAVVAVLAGVDTLVAAVF
jgi:hypothetical protein